MIYGVNLNLLLDLMDPSCNMLQLQLKILITMTNIWVQ